MAYLQIPSKRMSASKRIGMSDTKSFAARALAARLSAMPSNCQWAGYLPDHLRPSGVAAVQFVVAKDVLAEEEVSSSCSPGSRGSLPKKPSYEAKGMDVTGRVWELAQTQEGSREVQHAMDHASEDSITAILMELKDHVYDALRCPHANHVIQKGISMLPPQTSQFIVDALCHDDLGVQASRHRFGCRTVQRLFDHCSEQQVGLLGQKIIDSACLVACHPYGNYVIQHVIQKGSVDQKKTLFAKIRDHLQELCFDHYGCVVITSIMNSCGTEEQLQLSKELVKRPQILTHLACSRHGHSSLEAIFEVLDIEERKQVEAIFLDEKEKLLANRYGRIVATRIGLPGCDSTTAAVPA
eukprot:TRINITY_DN111041_c0_g1_i1.p1 TRINITY_DN111041_c0_g1~~TRINITY_DN111041_c0_g1_i1.p1  ORF type:complete len:354 (+),score=61.70 TRINITY_DN111041_c0_g1_i1:53-1114(+)